MSTEMTVQQTAPKFNPLHAIVDTFDIEIDLNYLKPKGDHKKPLMVGPFPMTLPLELCVNELTDRHASASVRLRAEVWALIISCKKTLSILLYNGSESHGHPLGNTRAAIQAIKSFAKAAFEYNFTSHQWETSTVDAVVRRYKA